MEKYQAPNVGKICKIELVNVALIDSFLINNKTHECFVNLLAGVNMTIIAFTEETASLRALIDGDDDGSLPFQRIALEFTVPQVSGSRVAHLESWKRQLFVCKATDISGRQFVVGTEMAPATLQFSPAIEERAGEENGYRVTITGYSAIGLLQAVVAA